jgi:hypothetical protein
MVTALFAGSLLATAVPASAADDPIDGARTSGDAMFPNVGNGGYDALDYDIDIAWSPTGVANNVITGQFDSASTTMTARALAPLRSFSLDFEGLTVDSVFVNGQPAQWSRDIDAAAIKYKLIVTPATPVTGEFTVTVNYSGVPQFHTDADGSQEGWSGTNDGAMLLGQPIGMMTGFPHNNTSADKATYTITVDAPTTLANTTGVTAPGAVASNGELQSKVVSQSGERTTWTWRQQKPMASELVIIGIGRYEVVEGSITLLDGRTIPSWSFIDFGLSDANKTTVRNRITQLQTLTQNLERMYGPYPGNSTGVVVKTVPSGINYALETQDRSFFPSVNSVNGNTLIHELVHQWYGNNVAPSTWTDIWMGEGMATWGPTYYNSSEGFGTGTLSEQTYYNSWNGTAPTSANWNTPPGAQTNSASLYGYQTYTRSAQFWAALRVAMGDEPFFTLIKQWQVDNAGKSLAGADLKALAEELSGFDLTAFWTDWILEPGKPAWPDKYSVAVAGGSPEVALYPGDTVSYTVTALNTGRVPLASTVVSVDVTALLANADIVVPEGATLDGTTLSWPVPVGTAVGTSASLTIDATISEASAGGSFALAVKPLTPGGSCTESCAVDTSVVEIVTPTELPTISGDAVVGETLTATSEGWPEGTELTYEWAIDGVPVEVPAEEPALLAARAADAGPSFVIPASALGARISVTVTGTLEGFRAGSVTSEATVAVAAAEVPGGGEDPDNGGGTGGGTGGGGAVTPGDSDASGEELSETGGELPTALGLLALVLLVGGGMFVAARRRKLEV